MGPDAIFNWGLDGQKWSLVFSGEIALVRLDGLEHGPKFPSPFKVEDLSRLNSAITPSKTLVLAHPDYRPYELKRLPDTWTLEPIKFTEPLKCSTCGSTRMSTTEHEGCRHCLDCCNNTKV